MNPLKKVLNKLNGLHYRQEYLCLARESFPDPIHAYLVAGNKVIKDITNHHLFVGYSPLVFTLPCLNEINLAEAESIIISFSQTMLIPNGILSEKDALATIHFKKMQVKFVNCDTAYFYEGIKAKHRFTKSFRQFILQLNNNLYNRKPGNVFLQGNLYTQVQIAYAVPRKISLITVGDGELYNLFPTDLHGRLDEQFYLISLRQNGQACGQVQSTNRILVSEMNCEAYKTVYALGKNHMQPMRSKESFPFRNDHSSVLRLPLPASAIRYRELELLESFDHGIHRFLLFKIISVHQIEHDMATLAHIHNVYATWRHNSGLPGNYFFR